MRQIQKIHSLEELESGNYLYQRPADELCTRTTRGIFEWLELFVFAVALIVLLFTGFFRVAVVDGDSMKGTLHNGDTIFVSNVFYRPHAGDVIVFQMQDKSVRVPIVKRVIATAGQTVEINYDTWEVRVDGQTVEEAYLTVPEGEKMKVGNVTFPYTVPQGCVFVLGDNRNDSWDSRYSAVGAIDTRLILGRVSFRILPFSDFGSIK